MIISLIAAIAGAVLYGSASVLQAVAVRRRPGLGALRQPLYLLGLVFDLTAWLASLVALRALPLFTVQAVLAGSLAVTVVLARIVLRAKLRVPDAAAVPVVIVCLAVLALAAGPDPASGAADAAAVPHWFTPTMVGALAALAAATAATYARGPGLWFAAVAGLGSSGAAISARAIHVVNIDGTAALGRLAAQPLAWTVIGFGAITVVAFARALERAPVGPATAVLSVIDVVIPGAVGLVALHDVVRAGWALGAVAATLAALAACVVLSMSPANASANATANAAPPSAG